MVDRFAWNFQRRHGVTMGRHDSILGQFGETARCTTRGWGLLCFSTTACWLFCCIACVGDCRGRSFLYRRRRKATLPLKPVGRRRHTTCTQKHWPLTRITSSPTLNYISTVLLSAQRWLQLSIVLFHDGRKKWRLQTMSPTATWYTIDGHLSDSSSALNV